MVTERVAKIGYFGYAVYGYCMRISRIGSEILN